ncbi:MAG: phosphoribosylformylglycinamidine synthase I [Candidatus Nanoarchaeia archaeon]|nr:phosphoribosylformylglycinamidine synthase I [Candidatus Nanoarchaeia archaeon]MDD5238937.1 phosphoribosylformylglycinamidine synthase I [Candidatus Nanoarchaeia archaeon]
MKPKVLVLTGYGINCDYESAHAFRLAGAKADIVHINDLINKKTCLDEYKILCFPGGFSYGDDTGSGKALANKIKNHLLDALEDFVSDDKLAIGVCNGFQVMVNLGLLPGEPTTALVHNNTARYNCRWVDLEFASDSPWTKDIGTISLPIAHGEGRFYAEPAVLKELNENNQVAARYISGEVCSYQHLPANPNGALEDIASITDSTGRLIGMMPHPERAVDMKPHVKYYWLKDHYKRIGKKMPTEGPGLKLFRNAVAYFNK